MGVLPFFLANFPPKFSLWPPAQRVGAGAPSQAFLAAPKTLAQGEFFISPEHVK